MRLSVAENIMLWIVKIGLWIIPFLPLYVSSSMLFPFITGKNFTFRIIIEIALALWAGLAVARQEFRPRLTPLFKTATAFIGILFLADLLASNPYRAFFSNYERMEGFMMIFHLYLYFVMLISVFNKRDWLIFFHVTLAASLIVSYIALLQKLGYRVSLQGGSRVDSTIGNPTYLAAYILFHIWLLFLLLYQFWKKWWLVILYAASMLFELIILYFTATRGATVALVMVLIPFLGVSALFWNRISLRYSTRSSQPEKPQAGIPRLRPSASAVANALADRSDGQALGAPASQWGWGRRVMVAVFVATIMALLLLWQFRDTDFVSQKLGRLARYSLQEQTIKSRFMIWGMSARAALERPILGWGQENYYLVFQKYFNPGLYGQEPWFDRSHNLFFDWLIHSGFLGLISFFSIFGAAFFMLFSAMRRGELPLWYGLVLAALFITHLIQNIFVFDNLNTYLLLFAFLAYTHYLARAPEVISAPSQKMVPKFGTPKTGLGYITAAFLVFAFLVAGYFLHLKPILASKALIRALQIQQMQRPLAEIKQAFEVALSYNTFGTTEIREQLGNAARGVVDNSQYAKEEQKQFIDFVASELRKEASISAKDVKHLLFLGSVLDRAVALDPQYAAEAERVLLESFQLSPTKQIIYFELAQLYLSTGRVDETLEMLRKAWDLDRNYVEAGANLLTIAILAGKQDLADEVRNVLDFDYIAESTLLRLANVYQRSEDFESAAEIYKRIIARSPENAQYRATYAAILVRLGRLEDAKKEVEEAVRLDPNFAKEAEAFLKMLQSVEKPNQ